MRFSLLAPALALLAVSAHATAHAQEGDSSAAAAQNPPATDIVWPYEANDLAPDPGYVFGQLDNGMRYVIRRNQRPEGTVLVRLSIGSGSLSERDDERGLAHFLEHMAFNGSTRVPEGEMVRLLEREGLAFGADTNASTGFEETQYKLDLPRNDPALIDTALMLMRETASELTIDPAAVDRERGVVLAERRDRRDFALHEVEDRFAFLTPDARYGSRFPIGTAEVLETADAARLRGYYTREYVPANAVVLVVGEVDPAAIEARIRHYFADWRGSPAPAPPVTGPVDIALAGQTDIYLDPALSERVTVSRHARFIDEPDSAANRRQNLLRQIGYAAVNRRLARLARGEDAPFRSAGLGTGDVFEDARTTNLIVDTADGRWEAGLSAAVGVVRSAMVFGFSQAEVDEQVAAIRTAQRNAVSAAPTRSNAAWLGDALALVTEEIVPTSAESSLARFEGFAPYITPASVLAALLDDAAPLDNPLIRFRGRVAPNGGEAALRSAWETAAAAPVAQPIEAEALAFAYTNFGPPGTVTADTVELLLGIRQLRFANGVMLNLKPTDLAQDRIAWRVHIDGGDLINTRSNPLATALVGSLGQGGLGRHSSDDLETILAGHNAAIGLTSGSDSFTSGGTTTRRDLELQLQLVAALLTDPGYRPEAEERYRRSVANYYKTLDATPGSTLSNNLGAILSDGDPRFSLRPEADQLARDFTMLRRDLGEALAHSAIELTLVGDFEPDAAIAAVAATLGALPARAPAFLARDDARLRSFTADRSPRVLLHRGEGDQALIRVTWPTRDDRDLGETARLDLLERVVRIRLTDELREQLGKAYSPSASSALSSIYPGYGSFSVTASVAPDEVDATRTAINATIAELRSTAVSPDLLARARTPLIEEYDNALKTNGGWLALADRSQSRPQDLERFHAMRDALTAVTAEDLREAAARYLAQNAGLEILVLPRPRE